MGRKPNPSKVVAIRLPEAIYSYWKAAADRQGKPVGTLIREKLTAAVPGEKQ